MDSLARQHHTAHEMPQHLQTPFQRVYLLDLSDEITSTEKQTLENQWR